MRTTTKKLPQFSSARCKQCGICIHFCAMHALGSRDGGMPYLADADACTSCGLCRDMCPDWAIHLEPSEMEVKEQDSADGDEQAEGRAGRQSDAGPGQEMPSADELSESPQAATASGA